jgi:hypothetical protein
MGSEISDLRSEITIVPTLIVSILVFLLNLIDLTSLRDEVDLNYRLRTTLIRGWRAKIRL